MTRSSGNARAPVGHGRGASRGWPGHRLPHPCSPEAWPGSQDTALRTTAADEKGLAPRELRSPAWAWSHLPNPSSTQGLGSGGGWGWGLGQRARFLHGEWSVWNFSPGNLSGPEGAPDGKPALEV